MTPDPIIETARLTRFPTAWARVFHHYNLLTEAGLSDLEALRIATLAEADLAPALTRQEGIAA